MWNDLLFSSLFFLAPLLVGFNFTKRISIAWSLGGIMFYLLFLTSSIIYHSYFLKYLLYIVFSFSVIHIAYKLSKNNITLAITTFIKKDRWLLGYLALILVLFSITYLGVWKQQTPYPLSLNWDIFEHLTVSNKIAGGLVTLLPSYITDTFTFNGYTTLFHTLLALPKVINNTYDLLGIYWFLEYWHYIILTITSFFLGRKVFNSNQAGLLASLLSGFIFNSSIIYNPLFVLPQTVSALLMIITTYDYLNEEPSTNSLKSLLNLLIPCIAIFMLHFVVGIVAVFILSIIFILKQNIFNISLNKTALLASALASLSFFSNLVGNLIITNREEANYFALNFSEKIGLIFDWYNMLIFLFLIGCVLIIKIGLLNQKILLIAGLIALAISLAPLSYFLKFYVIAGYFVNFIIAAGIMLILNSLPKKTTPFVLFWFGLVLSVMFFFNQNNYKESLYFQGFHSNISFQEIYTAYWLKERYDNALIISDPSTQYILESISGLNSQGGAYMNISTRNSLVKINALNNPMQVRNEISKIKDELNIENNIDYKTLLIVGGRYFAWHNLNYEQKKSFYYNIWRPYKINPDNLTYINFLANNFKIVYQNDELVIFEI